MNERLSLQDLIDLLAKRQEITKKEAETFLRELIAVISENIEHNEPVKIKDFGVFKLVKINARKSVDVNTGEAIEIAAHNKLSFIPDKTLKEAINRPFAHFESVVLEEGITFENIESIESAVLEDAEDVAVDDIDDAKQVDNIIVASPVIAEISENEASDIEEPEADIVLSVAEPNEPDVLTIIDMETETETETSETIAAPEPVNEELVVVDDLSKGEDNSPIEENDENSEVFKFAAKFMSKQDFDMSDMEYEARLEEFRKKASKKRRRLISLGFFIVLIIAAFFIGGLYFQKVAKSLSDASADNSEEIAAMDNNTDSISNKILPTDSITSKQDTVSPRMDVPDKPQEQKATEEKTVQPETKPVTPTSNAPLATIAIEPGNTLRNISLKYYGHKSFWVYIYDENKGKIKNPNNVPLGTKLVIPSPAKYGINSKDKASVDKAKAKEEKLFREMNL